MRPVLAGWAAGQGRSADSAPQNGELTMLGEITHLQGIIDDLAVLTAEPHKLPPASEQVCQPWDRTGGDGLPLLGRVEEKRGQRLGETAEKKGPDVSRHLLWGMQGHLPR